jgi:hypothetical protein
MQSTSRSARIAFHWPFARRHMTPQHALTIVGSSNNTGK